MAAGLGILSGLGLLFGGTAGLISSIKGGNMRQFSMATISPEQKEWMADFRKWLGEYQDQPQENLLNLEMNLDPTFMGDKMSRGTMGGMEDWYGGQIQSTLGKMEHSQKYHSAGLAQRQASAITPMIGQWGAQKLGYLQNLESRAELSNRFGQQMRLGQLGLQLQQRQQNIQQSLGKAGITAGGFGSLFGQTMSPGMMSSPNMLSSMAPYMMMMGMGGQGMWDSWGGNVGASGMTG